MHTVGSYLNRLNDLFGFVKSKLNAGSVSEISWVFGGQVINVGLGFVLLKLLSKLGSNDYGIYALVITISALLSIVFFGPVLQGFTRFYYQYLRLNQISTYINTVYSVLFISGILLLILTLIFSFFLPVIFEELPLVFFIFAGVFVISQRIGEFFNGFLNLIRKRKQNSLLQGGEKIILSAALLVLLLRNELSLISVFILFSIIISLFTIVKIWVFRKYVPVQQTELVSVQKVKKEIRSNIITYILPFLLWGISGWLQLNSEKWIIADLLTISEVGIYAIMLALVGAMIAIPSSILTEFSTPIIFQNYSDTGDTDRIKTGYWFIKVNMVLTFIITLLVTVFTAIFGKELIILISSPEYAVYWYLLPVLCFGSGLFYTGQSLTVIGMVLNQPKKYLPPKILTGILSVILNFLLIAQFGITGAAYSIVITGLLYLVYIIIVNKKLLSSMETRI
jgi:O-antigen/teichoic acid export membrane protein